MPWPTWAQVVPSPKTLLLPHKDHVDRETFSVEFCHERAICSLCNLLNYISVRTAATAAAPASNHIEVFIDGKPIMVEPGTTVLQVTHR